MSSSTETLRDRVLVAAWEEFGDKGYYGATMDEIAKRAGASKQALYHHFSNKDGLFRAVLGRAYKSLRASDVELSTRLDGVGPDEALRLLIESLFGTDLDSIRFQRLMHDENRFASAHLEGMDDIRCLYASLIALIQKVLDRGADDGSFRRGLDPAELFASLAGLFMLPQTNRYTLTSVLELGLESAEGAARSREVTVQLVLAGLRP